MAKRPGLAFILRNSYSSSLDSFRISLCGIAGRCHEIHISGAAAKVSDESVANVRGLASGALKPAIDRTFTFDNMVEVHRSSHFAPV
jgi:hypothetical protein